MRLKTVLKETLTFKTSCLFGVPDMIPPPRVISMYADGGFPRKFQAPFADVKFLLYFMYAMFSSSADYDRPVPVADLTSRHDE